MLLFEHLFYLLNGAWPIFYFCLNPLCVHADVILLIYPSHRRLVNRLLRLPGRLIACGLKNTLKGRTNKDHSYKLGLPPPPENAHSFEIKKKS